MKNFAITGVAGFVAPRHLQAIKDTGNRLLAACDPHDSVGVLDRYFPSAAFFTEFERFDRHLEKLRRGPVDGRIHYLSICSPNHLHDAHCRLALRVGSHAVCEKPLVLRPWNLDALQELEEEHGRKINTVLQLRVHPALQELRARTLQAPGPRRRISLRYVTSRGTWYGYSWKGNPEKSGGIAANIGIHFFDALIWIFGSVQDHELQVNQPTRMGGILTLEDADVEWLLSVDEQDLPKDTPSPQRTFRSITVDGEEVEFSGGFTDLHTVVYEEILAGRGYGIEDARPAIELVHSFR